MEHCWFHTGQSFHHFKNVFFNISASGVPLFGTREKTIESVHGGYSAYGGHGGHEKHREHVQHVESAAAHLLPDQPKVEDGVGDNVKEARLVNKAIRDLLLRSGQQVSSINHRSTACIEL